METKLTFKQWLQEAPLHDYETIGDFSKNSSFRDPRDRKIIQHPKAIERTRKKFGNTPFDFDFYFVNSPKANKHTEVGAVPLEWVKNNLGDEVYNTVAKNHGQDHIQVIFTNNKGAERVPLTAWMMAHRIGHAARRDHKFKMNYQYEEAGKHLEQTFSNILSYYTNRDTSLQRRMGEYSNTRANQLAMLYFFYEVATFKSARERNVRDWFEILNELIAQYLTTGKVKFKQAPRSFGGGAGANKQYFHTSAENIEEVNDIIETLARDMQYLIDDIFSSLINAVLVM